MIVESTSMVAELQPGPTYGFSNEEEKTKDD